MRSWISRAWTGLAVVILSMAVVAPAALAARAELVLKNGRTVSGEIKSETPEAVTLIIANIDTPFPREEIREIRYVKTPAEEYAQRRAALKDDDIDGRYRLAFWLFENKELDLARRELDQLSAAAPDNQQVQLLSRVVDERIKLRDSARPQQDPPAMSPAEAARLEEAGKLAEALAAYRSLLATAGDAQKPQIEAAVKRVQQRLASDPVTPPVDLPTQKLDAKAINLLRLYELPENLAAAKPRVVVPREVVEKIITDFANEDIVPKGTADQNRFRAAEGWQKLDLIFRLRARQFYDQITVPDDPPAMRTFRTQIHQRYVLNYCATSECHGGKKAGNLFLYRDDPNSEATVYTNFYILNQAQNKDGYLLDRDRAKTERSLLIQYGLPRNRALTPHPEVKGWRPQIRDERDPQYALLLDWVKSLYYPAPNYGISFTPPRVGPAAPAPGAATTSVPAPQPATPKP